ncbi:MAG: hypothetical protein M3252_05530 [Actinomycetota bacterium]|nr:hypothetical protein [Actinomycetota bacterium]
MRFTRMGLIAALVTTLTLMGGSLAEASHWWNGYKWATTDGVVDLYADVSQVQGEWARATGEVIRDWDNAARVEIDTSPAGKQGMVTVRSASYGPNGWLGVAMVSLEGRRIIGGRVLLNEWYWSNGFVTAPQARQHVFCQEVGHVFGLDHQDAQSCMNDSPSELGRWLHPNAHDYEQLDAIYRQTDGYNSGTLGGSSRNPQRARAAQNWVVVHSYPAPDHRANDWVAKVWEAVATRPVVSIVQR